MYLTHFFCKELKHVLFSDKMSEVGSEVFQCEYCDKVLASAQSLSHHRVLHTGLDLYRL